jgi:hypothetical protein
LHNFKRTQHLNDGPVGDEQASEDSGLDLLNLQL